MYPLVVVAGLILAVIGTAIPDEEKFNKAVKNQFKKLTGETTPPKPSAKSGEEPPKA